jgi:rhamnosyltransferase
LKLQKPFGIISALAMRKEGMPYRIRNRGVSSGKDSNLIEVDNVPSSFSLIPVTTFEKIGFFREDFFIDYIDMDFSLRCWKNNLPVYIARNATFTHDIGIGDVVIFKKRLFPYSDEYRHYYQVRNLILSFKFNNIGRFKTLIRVMERIVIVFVIGVYAGGFNKRMYFLFKGIYHGYAGVSGKLNTSN